jgi:uncharacterized repeat protein (TIGR01451 family)
MAVMAAAAVALACAGSAAASTTTYSSGDLSVAMPDNTPAGIDVPLAIPDRGTDYALRVLLRVSHTFNADIDASLKAPDGTTLSLFTDVNGGGDGLGDGAQSCSGTLLTLDDAAPTAIETAAVPPPGTGLTGTFRPETPARLATFNGHELAGVWTLHMVDDAAGDLGDVHCFQLQVTQVLHADLKATAGAAPATITAPGTIVFTDTVTNAGPDRSEPITLIDTLPPGTALITANASGGSCSGVATVTCTLPPLASGASTNATLAVSAPTAGTLANVFSVSSPGVDAVPGNDSASATAKVTAPPPDPRRCTIKGTPGNDVLHGGKADDVICGFAGNDRIKGLKGDDQLYGDAGKDHIRGGRGVDVVDGGAGADKLHGSAGSDLLTGGVGRDLLAGGKGPDLLFAHDGKPDTLHGGPGGDVGVFDRADDVTSVSRAG